jgi:putative ABC transport system permease protein
MNLVTLAMHNLKRRPIRTGLSILGVGLAVGSALALISLSHSIQDSAREGMDYRVEQRSDHDVDCC